MQFLTSNSGSRYANIRESINDTDVNYIRDNAIEVLNIDEYVPWNVSSLDPINGIVKKICVFDKNTPLHLFRRMHKLETLLLPDSSGKELKTFEFDQLESLKELDISSAKQFPKEIAKCGKIDRLHINGTIFSEISRTDFIFSNVRELCITRAGSACNNLVLSNFPNLKAFSISRPTTEMICISSRSIKALKVSFASKCVMLDLAPCIDLEELNLNDLKRLDSISTLSENKQLRRVAFDNLSSLTDLHALSSCKELTQLLLLNCPKILSLKPLLENKKLQYLSLLERTSISDGELRLILAHEKLCGFTFVNKRHYDLKLQEIESLRDRMRKYRSNRAGWSDYFS